MERELNEEEIKQIAKVYDVNLITDFSYSSPLRNLLVFQSLSGLKQLTLSGCSLKVINEMKPIKSVRILDLSQNLLWSLDGIASFPHLLVLKAEGNNIGELKGLQAVQALKSLVSLSL